MSKSGEPNVRGPWSVTRTLYEFLEHVVIPMRIGVESSSGCPLVLSLWFIAEGYELLGATQSSSVLARSLERTARCGFEVAADAPPYRGVRGQAHVELKQRKGLQSSTACSSVTSDQGLIHLVLVCVPDLRMRSAFVCGPYRW